MPAAVIPAIYAASAIGGGIASYKAAKAASKPSPLEQQALQTQTGASQQLLNQGRTLSNYGLPLLQQGGRYFSTLAGGNRAALGQQLAPDVANLNDVYGGTQRTLQRFLRGPDRDFQMGELARQKAGAIGSLFTGARDRAAGALTSLGQYGVSGGTSALGGAAGIAGNVGAAGFQNRAYGNQVTQQAGAGTAQLIFNLLQSYLMQRGGGGGGSFAGVPNLPVTSGWAGSGYGG